MSVNKFKKISIGEKGMVLQYRHKESKEISFSEISKIYIKVKKVPTKYIVFFVGLSISIVLILVWIYGFNLVAISPSFLIIVGVIKLNSHKKYVLKIALINGDSIIQPIPLKSKYQAIDNINII